VLFMVQAMLSEEDEAAVAAFIRNRGVTRCPTACVSPTQASPDPADRAALARYATDSDERTGARQRWFARAPAASPPDETKP
jgi:hypothetical protein